LSKVIQLKFRSCLQHLSENRRYFLFRVALSQLVEDFSSSLLFKTPVYTHVQHLVDAHTLICTSILIYWDTKYSHDRMHPNIHALGAFMQLQSWLGRHMDTHPCISYVTLSSTHIHVPANTNTLEHMYKHNRLLILVIEPTSHILRFIQVFT